MKKIVKGDGERRSENGAWHWAGKTVPLREPGEGKGWRRSGCQ